MKYLFFVLSIFFLVSCNNRLKDKKYISSISSSDSLAFALQGIWGGDEAPTWEIGLDSIFYYSEKKSYYYFIHGSDMIVLYKSGPYKLKNIKMVNDTFFCGIDNMNVKFFRYKNNKPIQQNLRYAKNRVDTAEVKKSILGKWGYKHSKGVFSWLFTKDSINYIQRHKTFMYKQNENSIIVLTDEDPILMKDILVRGDTMYFTTQDSILIKAHRMH